MKKRIVAVLMLALLLFLTACQSQPREIREATINEKGELEIVYTDGTQSNLGVVRGADGKNGADGKDGKDGKDGEKGATGATGAVGATGATGPVGAAGTPGRDGREITDIDVTAEGTLVITYNNEETSTVELVGNLYLFGGTCEENENAVWAVYNGGLLILGGTGEMNYAAGEAPWSPLIPLLTAVYVETGDGLTLGEETLAGFAPEQIFAQTYVWVDMTVSASLYAEANTNATVVENLPLGTKLTVLAAEGETFLKVSYNGQEGYIETRYTATSNGSVVYEDKTLQVTVTNEGGVNLRTFPDATSGSAFNIDTNVPKNTVLTCTGMSLNGRWLRISYEGKTLYCMAELVQLPAE